MMVFFLYDLDEHIDYTYHMYVEVVILKFKKSLLVFILN